MAVHALNDVCLKIPDGTAPSVSIWAYRFRQSSTLMQHMNGFEFVWNWVLDIESHFNGEVLSQKDYENQKLPQQGRAGVPVSGASAL